MSESFSGAFAALTLSTVPDIDAGQRLFGLQGLDDKAVIKAMEHLRKQQTGGDSTQPLALQRMASFALRWGGQDDEILCAAHSDEVEMLRGLFSRVQALSEKGVETVGWQLHAYDIPLLRLRAMRHRLLLPACWAASPGLHDPGDDLADLLGAGEEGDWRLVGEVMGAYDQTEMLDAHAIHTTWLAHGFDRLQEFERNKVATVFCLFQRYGASVQR